LAVERRDAGIDADNTHFTCVSLRYSSKVPALSPRSRSTSLGQSDDRHRESPHGDLVACQLARRRRLEAGGLIHEVHAATLRAGNGRLKSAVAFVHEQDFMLAIPRDSALRINVRDLGSSIDKLVPGTEVIMEKFQRPETRVRLAGFPMPHGAAGKLGGISLQLRFARHVDPLPGKLRID